MIIKTQISTLEEINQHLSSKDAHKPFLAAMIVDADNSLHLINVRSCPEESKTNRNFRVDYVFTDDVNRYTSQQLADGKHIYQQHHDFVETTDFMDRIINEKIRYAFYMVNLLART